MYASDVEAKTTRHLPHWEELPAEPVTLSLTVSGNAITVSGVPCRANACVVVDGQSTIVTTSDSDNQVGIAAAFATHIPGASSSGNTLTVPGTQITARVGGFGNVVRELKRQKKGYQITVWAGTPEQRDAVAPLADAALAAADYLSLPDGCSARLLYERSRQSDRAEKDNLYRRDLFYSAEFSTTQSVEAARVVSIGVSPFTTI